MDLLGLLSDAELLCCLLAFLSPRDVLTAACVSSRARHLLGSDLVWRRLARRAGHCRTGAEFLMRDYGEYHETLTRLGMEPLSSSCYKLLYPRHVQARWRTQTRSLAYMEVDDRLTKDQLLCYDVGQDFLALGTLLGKIIIWRLRLDVPQLLEGSLDQKIDKITIRHSKIIVLQGGLLSVYSQEDERLFQLKYRKSFESPDPRLLGEAGDRDLSSEEFRRRYRARDPVSFPGQQVTVSTTGEEIFGSVRLGQEELTIHHLETGQQREAVRVELRVEHLAIVHFMQFRHLMYLLLRSSDSSQLVGRFHNLHTGQTHSELALSEEFDVSAGFYSLFCEHGLLMVGRAPHTDSQTYQWCCWSYDGHLVYRHTGWAEFGLCLADLGPRSLTTPRSLTLLHNTSRRLTFSERTHRGAAVTCLAWQPGEVAHTCREWRLSSSLSLASPRPGCLVAGAEVAGVVVTVAGVRAVTVRAEDTGRVLWEAVTGTDIQNVWVGDTHLVTIPPDFRQGNTVCCVHIE